jgi:hypothetical protein
MQLSAEKLGLLWKMIQRHKTLFSDLTRGDALNFINTITAPDTLWFEVREHGVLVGIIWFGDLAQVVDYSAHMMFFDKRPSEKADVCKALIKWMFKTFPIHRITVNVPALYHGVIRLMKKIGLRQEGCKRGAVLLYGKWNDMSIFGITRSEAEAL